MFSQRTRRMVVVTAVAGSLAAGNATPVLALAYGVGGTPTPTPVVTPTPTPTPKSTPEPAGPRTYNYPADGSFVSIVLPVGWTATAERGGKLLCAPDDPATGYSATLAAAGSFSGPEQAKSFLNAAVKETISAAKVRDAKPRALQTGKLGSGVECLIEVVDGRLGPVPTSYVFMCFAPVPGRYVVFIARGRSDKLSASGFDVVGAMADSVKGL